MGVGAAGGGLHRLLQVYEDGRVAVWIASCCVLQLSDGGGVGSRGLVVVAGAWCRQTCCCMQACLRCGWACAVRAAGGACLTRSDKLTRKV